MPLIPKSLVKSLFLFRPPAVLQFRMNIAFENGFELVSDMC